MQKLSSKLSSRKEIKTPDDWASDVPDTKALKEKGEGRAEEPKKERAVPFTLRIPESLNDRLNEFIETKARRKESKNYCIVKGLEMFLDSVS